HRELDVDRVDLHTSADDQVLGAPAHRDEPITVHPGEVASAEPAVGMKGAARRLFVAILARVLVGTSGLEMALFARRQRLAVIADNACFMALPGRAYARKAQRCGYVQRVHDRHQHLAHAPDLVSLAVRAGPIEDANGFRGRGRPTDEAALERVGDT